MKINCDVIRDLLPLYVDGISSEGSAKLVEEHIADCAECRDVFSKLKNTEYDNNISEEKEIILQHTYEKTRRRTFIAGGVISGILMIPIVVCLIVNLATGHALDWFFIVLTSLMLTASLIVVPLMASEKKLLYTSLTSLGSLFLLLAVCCIYTKGRWFFIAAVSVLMGFAAVVLPILISKYYKVGFLKNNKGLVVYCSETILLVLLFLCIGIYINNREFVQTALMIASVPVISMWIMFIAIRYLHTNLIIKTGSVTAMIGLFTLIVNPWVNNIISEERYLLLSDDNIINTILALSLVAIGMVVILTGIIYAIIVRKKSR